LSDATLRLWARVLEATPGSRLLLKGHGFDEPQNVAEWRGRFSACGLDPHRVDLVGRIASTGGHLALYARVDVALDPFPYHGTTTTCEALWMGRPVVTLAGGEHRSRVGVSLLSAAGHPEWIAETPDSYVEIACALARDLEGRRALAASLRENISRGALLDYAGQARAFSSALRSCTAEVAKTLARG
jgi:predicted O-linked N-acetylglucosamine transferase (SPINDLY family)